MAEGIDVRRLGDRLRRVRLQRHKTLKEVAEATGVSVATLSRVERGEASDLESGTLLAVTDWMGTSVERLKRKPQPVVRGGKLVEETPDIVELYLRADRNLDERTATALAKVFRTAYDELSKGSRKAR
jgi:transcriptional regulator with XRE-family HTH domain